METRIKDYLKRSGDSELSEGTLEENEHGFCIWRIEDNTLVLVHVYGDGQYWNEWATSKAREMNIKDIYFATQRNPEGFVRRHGFEVIGYILKRSV